VRSYIHGFRLHIYLQRIHRNLILINLIVFCIFKAYIIGKKTKLDASVYVWKLLIPIHA